jgi:predicted house-cleaning NTP pyrophosphatase (Maf/HAM1 superfamily)
MWFQTADIDEKSIRRENPDDLVMVLAEAKVGTKFPALFRPPFW